MVVLKVLLSLECFSILKREGDILQVPGQILGDLQIEWSLISIKIKEGDFRAISLLKLIEDGLVLLFDALIGVCKVAVSLLLLEVLLLNGYVNCDEKRMDYIWKRADVGPVIDAGRSLRGLNH